MSVLNAIDIRKKNNHFVLICEDTKEEQPVLKCLRCDNYNSNGKDMLFCRSDSLFRTNIKKRR